MVSRIWPRKAVQQLDNKNTGKVDCKVRPRSSRDTGAGQRWGTTGFWKGEPLELEALPQF